MNSKLKRLIISFLVGLIFGAFYLFTMKYLYPDLGQDLISKLLVKNTILLTTTSTFAFLIAVLIAQTPLGRFYMIQMQPFMRTQFKHSHMLASMLKFCLYTFGLMIYVIPHALNIGQALGWGSLFGFIIAGSVNLVNYSLINNWSGKLAIVDTLLATFMIGLSSGLLFWLGRLF